MKQMTEFELFQAVGKFYKDFLIIDKAIALYKLEYGVDVEVVEVEIDSNINIDFCEDNDINPQYMMFMKELQESGECNMIVGNEIKNIIQQRLLLDKDEARELHRFYLSNHTEVFYPENLI